MKTSEPIVEYRFPTSDLTGVATAAGPFVSVYVTTERAVDNASHRSEVHWKDVRRDLHAQGAPAAVLAEIDPLVPDAHHMGGCLAVIATTDGIRHVEHGGPCPPTDVGRWGPVPRLAPIIEWRQSHIPHLIVLADRTGADLIAVTRERGEMARTTQGDDDVIRKVHPGGWSQRRYQQRAEDSWEHNAEKVAREATAMALRSGAELMFGAGDVRALGYLRESLPKEWRAVYREVSGARDAHVKEHVRAQVDALVSAEVAQRSAAVAERLREELGQGDLGCEGIERTVAALARGQVEALLLAPGAGLEHPVWFGSEPLQLAMDRDGVEALGATDPREGPLLDVAIRAALGTDASVRMVPPEERIKEGIGGVLRWATAPPTA
jgi:hypothetical protein